MLLLLLAACIENGFVSHDEKPPRQGAGADTAASDTATADTAADTAAADTAPTGDTAVDTAAEPDTDTPTDTADTAEPDPEPPGPLAVEGVCASPWTGWTDNAATEPELHVVGVYESQLGNPGAAYVTVTRTTQATLVLTSYSAVDWQVDLAAGTQVSEVVVSSYEGATVTFTGAASAPVTDVGWIGACAYEIPDANPTSGCETPDLQRVTEGYAGLAWSSFQGCYAGGEFVVEG